MNSDRYDRVRGIRFRTIVAAWQEDEKGECVDGTCVERVVCVEVDFCPEETQSARARDAAKAIIQVLYPLVNSWDIYNTENEKDSPAEVLGFVTGFAGNAQRYESHPVVAFRRPHEPAKYRELGAGTWEEYFGREHPAIGPAALALASYNKASK